MVYRVIIALFLIACFPVAAHAGREEVRCVQEQLNAAGHDTGAIDGMVGPQTRRALWAFAAAQRISDQPNLTAENAVSWCRRIGQAQDGLRRFWPSLRNGVIVQTSASVDSVLARLIRTRMPAFHREVAELLGVELAGTDRVLVGTGVADLRDEMRRSPDFAISNPTEVLEQHCNGDGPIGGFAVPGLMVICLDPSVGLRSGITYSHLSFVLAHEATHLVQFQMTGVPPRSTPVEQRVAVEGPIWLLEGLADAVGYVIGDGAELGALRAHAVRGYDTNRLPDLARLQDRRALQSNRSDIYTAGMIAATLMLEERGFEEAGHLFETMGEGIPFEDAFTRIYGESVMDFYAGYTERAVADDVYTSVLRTPPIPGTRRKF